MQAASHPPAPNLSAKRRAEEVGGRGAGTPRTPAPAPAPGIRRPPRALGARTARAAPRRAAPTPLAPGGQAGRRAGGRVLTLGPLPRRYLAIPGRGLRRLGRRPQGAARSQQSVARPRGWGRRGLGGDPSRRRRRLASAVPAPSYAGVALPRRAPGTAAAAPEATVTATVTAAAMSCRDCGARGRRLHAGRLRDQRPRLAR